jgi:hydroxymethylpyrimidine/phosphomethylpyrimidine kinase
VGVPAGQARVVEHQSRARRRHEDVDHSRVRAVPALGQHRGVVAPSGAALVFDDARLPGGHTHGTGCTLSSAIATLLGHGQALPHAVRLARQFVRAAIENAPGFGGGNGPLGHQAVRSLE